MWHLYQGTSASFLTPFGSYQDRCVKGPGNVSDRWLTLMNNFHFRSCNVSRKSTLQTPEPPPWISPDSRHNIKATTLVWLPFSLLSIDFQLITEGNTKRPRWVPNKTCLSFFIEANLIKAVGWARGFVSQNGDMWGRVNPNAKHSFKLDNHGNLSIHLWPDVLHSHLIKSYMSYQKKHILHISIYCLVLTSCWLCCHCLY